MNSLSRSSESHNLILLSLKDEIEQTFGKKITVSRDCILLSEEVYGKISLTVNSNTLRRFFGLIRSNHFPSHNTLDILSRYCGFASFDEFKSSKIHKSNANAPDFYSQSILNYLVALFRYVPAPHHGDKMFSTLVEHTIYFLQQHRELIDKFQRAVAKTINGRNYYYEQFINIDEL